LSAASNVRAVAASLLCRLLVVAFGIALFWFLGFSLVIRVFNPPSWSWFLIHAYGLAAGVMAFVYFFSGKVGHLAFILPAVLLFTPMIGDVALL
jgi:hypothetical protein